MWQPPGLRALNEVLWELPPSDLQVLFYHRMLRCWRILARKHTRRCLIDERIAVEDLKEVAAVLGRTAAARGRTGVRAASRLARLSPTAKLRVLVQDAELEDVPAPPNTLAEVVRIQKERGQR